MAIYLDYNSTTPVDDTVQAEIFHALKTIWANPSSSYVLGKEAKEIIGNSRCKVAKMIDAMPEEIIFTSGGTESNNMVLHTMLRHYNDEQQPNSNNIKNELPHIITTNIEHDSVKLPLEVLLNEGKAKVTFVPVSKETGVVDIEDIINEIRPNTRLITVMLANNETGIIQPVSLIKDYLKSLKTHSRIYIHTDAAQAIGKIKVDVQELDVDYLTVVGHKFYGPRIGALYFRKSCPLHPIFYGGGQESSYRPGTENTCMIIGLGKAAELVNFNLQKYHTHMATIKEYLEKSLKNTFLDKIILNVKSNVMTLPNTVSVAFNYDNVTAKMLLNETCDVYASTGAACHSDGKPSSVLIASGISEHFASKTLRLSVGRETTKEDIDIAIRYLKKAMLKLSTKST